jgi:hypothetical protein
VWWDRTRLPLAGFVGGSIQKIYEYNLRVIRKNQQVMRTLMSKGEKIISFSGTFYNCRI